MSQKSKKSRSDKQKKVKARSKNSLETLASTPSSFFLSWLPDLTKYENAPEIAHLKIRRDFEDQDQLPGEENNDIFGEVKQSCLSKLTQLIINLYTKLKNCLKSDDGSGELDDLDPVAPRTRHSLQFISQLADKKANKSLGINSRTSYLASENNPSVLLTKRAYKSIFDGLSNLREANYLYKQLILMLTFTRYAEFPPLDEFELNLTHGKTVIGSYAWLATYALQQLQYDPDVEINGYPAQELKEIIRSMEQLVTQTVYMWKSLLQTIETVEKIHQKVEHVFTALIRSFPQSRKDLKIVTTRHIKVNKKFQHRAEELERLKHYDAFKSAQTWTKFSFAPLRILYKDERGISVSKRTSSGVGAGAAPLCSNWVGFDLLHTNLKFSALKMLQLEIFQISQAVLDQLEKINKLLHHNPTGNPSGATTKKPQDMSTVRCFEDGIVLMGRYLEQLHPISWTPEEIKDFLEVEKITLDNLDLLTLATATLRTLIHEARHIIHVTYETARDLDYMECRLMNTYEEIVAHCQKGFGTQWEFEDPNMDILTKSDGSNKSRKSKARLKKKKQSIYDIDELNIQPRDAEFQFERSIYQDILKELCVTTNMGAVGFTLQDAELVFTESSQNLLSGQIHV